METQQQISALAREIMTLKEQETRLKEIRQEREEALAACIVTKFEGTDKAEVDGLRVTVISKFTRTLDYPAYQALEAQIPVGLRCVEMKPQLDLKRLRAMDMARPGFSAQFITTKPARPAIKIEMLEAV